MKAFSLRPVSVLKLKMDPITKRFVDNDNTLGVVT